jgi:carboxyl-terminal processing protease
MKLKKLYNSPVALMLYGVCIFSAANGQIQLAPDGLHFDRLPQHAIIAKTIATTIANYHYKKVNIDDSLSTRIFDNYLSKLDKTHSILLTSDIKEFEPYRFKLDDALLSGDLTSAFKLYSVYAQRMNERVDYALNALETAQNLSTSDVFDFTREQLPWFKSISEENQYWNKRIRYELISLQAVNKDKQKAYEVLGRRYEKMKKGLQNLKAENAFEAFMNAFTETIDPHTTYFSPKAAADFNMLMNKSLEGIGITFSFQDELPVIQSVVKGGPADKSGQIAINDRILAIAQGETGEFEDVVGWTQDEVVQKMRGTKGSVLRLRILPAGAALVSKPVEVRLVRDKIVLEDQKVKSEIKTVKQDGNVRKIGVISIPNFYFDALAYSKGDKNYASTSADVRKALDNFKGQGVEGVMVDLRNNGGGSLKEAIDLSGLFINYGPVVQTRNAKGNIEVMSDKDSLEVYNGSLTIVINRLSASASEIFSAAMQDYGRAVIIGEQSFGKGTVQSVYPVEQLLRQEGQALGSLKLTTAKFYRINGASTQHRGVTPDISFPSMYEFQNIGESTLKNVLPYDQVAEVSFSPTSDLKEITKLLKQHHEERMWASQEFKFLAEDIQKLKEADARKSVVLDLGKFVSLQDQQQADELKRLNLRRKLQGLGPVTAIGAKAKSDVDYVKDESLQITAELINKINK